MGRNATWTNDDGLVVGFGTRTNDNEVSAVVGGKSNTVVIRQVIDLADLEDTDSITIASFSPNAHVIPRGSFVKRATIQATVTPTTGSTSLLDIGFYDADTSSITVDDADGIDADVTLAAMTIGDMVDCNGALVGATYKSTVLAVGATSDSDVVVIAGFETAAFTAGQIILTVEYIPPTVVGRTIAN